MKWGSPSPPEIPQNSPPGVPDPMEITIYEQTVSQGRPPHRLFFFDQPSPNARSGEETPNGMVWWSADRPVHPIKVRVPDGSRVEHPTNGLPHLVWPLNSHDTYSDASTVHVFAELRINGFGLVPDDSQKGYQNDPGPVN